MPMRDKRNVSQPTNYKTFNDTGAVSNQSVTDMNLNSDLQDGDDLLKVGDKFDIFVPSDADDLDRDIAPTTGPQIPSKVVVPGGGRENPVQAMRGSGIKMMISPYPHLHVVVLWRMMHVICLLHQIRLLQ